MRLLLNSYSNSNETGVNNLKSAKSNNRWKLISWHQILLAALLYQLLSCRLETVGAAQVDQTSIKGWTEVNKKWPLETNEFFVAHEKGHHFIEVKLTQQLNHDLDIRLEYYYDYAKVRPVFQMVPCSTNVDIIKNNESVSQRSDYIDSDRYMRDSAQPAGKWLTHEMRVRKVDCERRRELAYNVLLHDKNDVFAWRVIEIKSVPDATTLASTLPAYETETTQTYQTADTTESAPVTELPQTPTTSEQSVDSTESGVDPQSQPESAPLVTTEGSIDDNSVEDIADQFTKKPGEEVHYNPNKETTPRPSELDTSETTTEGVIWRLKRAALFREEQAGGSNEPTTSLICRPSSCDRSLFHHPRFMPLVRGVPKLPRPDLFKKDYKYYLNTDNKELEILQKSDQNFSDVDVCVDLELYMDPGTAIEFHVEDNNKDGSKSRLLELIERNLSSTEQSSGKWEEFKRCMSDYIPKLRPVDSTDHSIKLKFVPRPAEVGKQIALLANSQRAVALRKLFPLREYLPNVATLTKADDLGSSWILDKDGSRKPKLKFQTRIPNESTSGDSGEKRVLRISDIDPKQESFDITSRWLKVSDLETLENPINLFYRADRADWVKGVEFQFQKATYPCDTWNTRKLYVEFNPIEQDIVMIFITDLGVKYQNPKKSILTMKTNFKTFDSSIGETSSSNTITTTTTEQPNGEQLPGDNGANSTIATTSAPISLVPQGQMLVPIKVIGLNEDEFRIRIRHIIKEEAQQANTGLRLDLITLAFADACAETDFCLNGGSCKPTGTASAKCTCLAGYFGEHCQVVKPCEIIYGIQTGNQLCELAGAKCDERLPVLRCVWPNDQYYECRALFKEANGDQHNQTTDLIPTMASSELEERLNDQTRTIIILSVFMAALLLFSVVIIGNMVSRLMESKKRLRKAERETHELARRSQPGGSAQVGVAAFGRLPSRQKAATVSYNNQAFDTE